MNETELVQIYCEDGKGKTTVAIDTTVQAAGRRYRMLTAKLLKTDDSGEVTGFSHVPGIAVLSYGRSFGFPWNMIQIQWKATALYYDHCPLNTWNMALGADGGEPYDALVLDETIDVCNPGFVGEVGLVKVLRERPTALEVILIGCYPSEALRDQADYITEMVTRRHPYEHGVGAKEGIRYQRMDIREYVLTF